jgi:hypothetical protein
MSTLFLFIYNKSLILFVWTVIKLKVPSKLFNLGSYNPLLLLFLS